MPGASGRDGRRCLFALLEQIAREVPEAPALLRRLRSRRRDPLLRLLAGTLLSHQTTAPEARRATARLWRRYHKLHRLARIRPDEILPLVATVGLGRLKARRLVALARVIEDRWGSIRALGRYLRAAPLPEAWRALLALPGSAPSRQRWCCCFGLAARCSPWIPTSCGWRGKWVG
jgi:endonuclease III